jgi:AcrR family transcriptional regulator
MNKQEILQKIEPLFYEKSYKEVSLQDIADIFNIKKASLYYYFPSKQDLFISVLEYSFNEYLLFINNLISRWNENNFQELLNEFLNFPENKKNLFSKINLN